MTATKVQFGTFSTRTINDAITAGELVEYKRFAVTAAKRARGLLYVRTACPQRPGYWWLVGETPVSITR